AAITKNKAFNVLAPSGCLILSVANQDYGAVGVNSMGMRAKFTVQVTPNTVNFKNVEFTEDIPEQKFKFPSGYEDTRPASGPPDEEFKVKDDAGRPNITPDQISSSTFDPKYLIPPGKKDPVDYNDYIVLVPNKYKQEDGSWSASFVTEKHGRQFRAADYK